MSIQILNAVWQHSQSTGRARLILLAIADHQGEIGAWPSIGTLARMANASERSVQRDIQTLQELGELSVEVQNAPTRQQYKSNLYWVILPGVTEMNSGVTDSTSGVTETQSGVTEMASGVTAGGVRTITKPLLEPLLNQRPHKLPNDWQPTTDLIAMFETKWPDVDQALHTENFKLHWWSTGGTKQRWDMTFQKWMNSEQDRANKTNSRQGAYNAERAEQDRIKKEWGQL